MTDSTLRIANCAYEVEVKRSGEAGSRLCHEDVALTRPSYEGAEPAGRLLFVTEVLDDGRHVSWPVLGNHPEELFPKAVCVKDGNAIRVALEAHELRTTLLVTLPDDGAAVEFWTVTVENLADRKRALKLSPYLEWLLESAAVDRNHTQYTRLYPEMSYDRSLNAVLALHRRSGKVGFLAAAEQPEGFLTGRVDFIGRAGTVWRPRVLDTFAFSDCVETSPCPTFDPIGALLLGMTIGPKGHAHSELLVGCADSKAQAADWIRRFLEPRNSNTLHLTPNAHTPASPVIGHGEIPPGTPLPYTEYEDGGAVLHVRTPFTPRPFDHTMANAGGHVLCVTNRGLHSSANGDSQRNRLTTDWADLVGRQMPSEAFYIYEEGTRQWYSPTYEPLRDREASHDVRFGLDGSATFLMRRNDLETELSTHVPVDDPTGVYLLTLRNNGPEPKRLRVAPYFQIALAHSPEMVGALDIELDDASGALFFANPGNASRSGPAFVATTETPQAITTSRGAFFGEGRSFTHPAMVETGREDGSATDSMSCAGLLAAIELPAGGEKTIAVLLGQADTMADARECIGHLCSVDEARHSLAKTRSWWRGFASTLKVETSNPEFDGYLDWMKYQALAERIWARKGFYQASGAFGFRDQLQDTVNLVWADPSLARRQLLLHASQQFLEGDVAHWFFILQDGRTGFLSRSHASDNLLWLGWGVAEYIRMTGDTSLLDEEVTYLDSETPLPPLPEGKHGMGFVPLRSTLADSVYNHVLLAIDLVFDKRMGPNGLPLIGTGDWNDGLDEIGSEGRGESVWLAFFIIYFLNNLLGIIGLRSGAAERRDYERKLAALAKAAEATWRADRYLRAIHDDGTEIGLEGAGCWEIDALTAAWAVYAGINFERGRIAVDTALRILETDRTISLGYPPLRADSKPFMGRSSHYPEGVRENGMYSHGVQWLVRACRLLAEKFAREGDTATAQYYRDAAARLWFKISAISHTTREEIEIYGGQPNKQCADCLTRFEPGRMIWNGYTGAAAWMFRQAIEGVMGYELDHGVVKPPADLDEPRGDLMVSGLKRNLAKSPLFAQAGAMPGHCRCGWDLA